MWTASSEHNNGIRIAHVCEWTKTNVKYKTKQKIEWANVSLREWSWDEHNESNPIRLS